jgi:hypothetical protein
VRCGSGQSGEERITTLFAQMQLEQVGSRRAILDAYPVFYGYRDEPVLPAAGVRAYRSHIGGESFSVGWLGWLLAERQGQTAPWLR